MQSKNRKSFRRAFDTTVRSAGDDRLSTEVFLSENGVPLILWIEYSFSKRQVIHAYREIPKDAGVEGSRLIKEDLPELYGMQVQARFVKKAHEAIKHRDSAESLLDAFVDSARMLAQVGMFSLEQLSEIDFTDPMAWRRLDLSAWPELADGCLAYSKELEPRIEAEGIMPDLRIDLYAASEGQVFRFRRDTIIECQLTDEDHTLSAYLSDDVHELVVRMTVSSKDQKVKAIHSQCLRAPYLVFCQLPFPRVSELVGLSLDADFKKKLKEAVGGRQGCIHLTDLIIELIRYYHRALSK
ncbi:DUF2889 domain-containing protein [Thermodesulfobacteriota bacterium]